MMAFILTRIKVGDYKTWKPMFDSDGPGARKSAKNHRLLRNADDPNEVFIIIEFASAADAREAQARLLASGGLDRFEDKSGPTVAEEAGFVSYSSLAGGDVWGPGGAAHRFFELVG